MAARFRSNGKTYQLDKADPRAKFVIHGGTAAFSKKVWKAEIRDGEEPSLILTLEPARLATAASPAH